MRIQLDPEGGMEKFEVQGPTETPGPQRAASLGLPVADLVKAALAGELPRLRPLKPSEPDKLSATHVNIIMDRALGFKPHELADKYDMALPRISVILHHPDAEYLIAAIQGRQADALTDPIRRLQGYAHEAINTKIEILRDAKTKPELRNTVASDILDRAGYGARQKIDVEETHRVVVSAEKLSTFENVLRESQRVASIDYTKYISTPAQVGDEADSAVSQGPAMPLVQSGEPGTPSAGVSPSPSASPEAGIKVA